MKLHLLGILTIALSLSTAGCGKKSIEEICKDSCKKDEECNALESQTVADCSSSCEEQLKDISGDCEDSVRDLAKCADKASCEELEDGSECFSELLSTVIECPDLFSEEDEQF